MQTVQTSVQHGVLPLLGQLPGLVGVDVLLTRSASSMISRAAPCRTRALVELDGCPAPRAQASSSVPALDAEVGREAPAEAFWQEAGGAAGDVDVLADQVAVDAGHEVVGLKSRSSTRR